MSSRRKASMSSPQGVCHHASACISFGLIAFTGFAGDYILTSSDNIQRFALIFRYASAIKSQPRAVLCGSGLVLFIIGVRHYIFNVAFEYPAKHFYRVRADAFVSFEPRDLPGADVVLLNQRILRNALFLHGFP